MPMAPPEGERAHVAHEDLGGVGVEPEEAEAGADQGAAEDRHLADARDVGDLEVVRRSTRLPAT